MRLRATLTQQARKILRLQADTEALLTVREIGGIVEVMRADGSDLSDHERAGVRATFVALEIPAEIIDNVATKKR